MIICHIKLTCKMKVYLNNVLRSWWYDIVTSFSLQQKSFIETFCYRHFLSYRVIFLWHFGTKSASSPPSEFWCLNDKTIKELMTFAKCEIGKISYKLHWDHSLFKIYVMVMMIIYLCMPYDKKKLSNKKEEIELIIYVSCQLAP
jgi:hypothetical protein